MSCEFASLRTNIERTLERTGHLVAGIAGEIEGDVILFAVPGHGYRTAGDAGIARHGIVFHADIPGTARECRVGVAPASGRNIAWLELVCRVVFGGGYGIGTVGEVVFVVVVLLYRFGIEVDAKFVARSGEIPHEIVFDSLIPKDKVPGSFRFVAVVVVYGGNYPIPGKHSEIDILFERTEEFGLALLHHGNLERADIFHIRGDHHSGGTRVGGSVLPLVEIAGNMDFVYILRAHNSNVHSREGEK